MTGQEIEALMSISEFQKAAGQIFLGVHRSYVVNKAYISCIRQYEIVMADDSRIPVPVKKYREIRETLAKIYEPQGTSGS